MQDQIGQVLDRRREAVSEPASGAATSPPTGSISFVIATVGRGPQVEALLDTLERARGSDDELILLIRADRAQTFTRRPPWLRVVTVPDASIFRLRSQVPAICRKEWVVVLEDHSLLSSSNIEAIRRVIRERPETDIIPFLTKNLTSTRSWDWAIFLFNFALVWAPLDHPPPFSIVTSAIVRRAALRTKAPFKDGEWELRVVPGLFATGRREYSNDIFIDHVKPLSFIPAVTLIFHNARAGAALQRDFGIPTRNVLKEGWFAFAPRPPMLMNAVAARRHELPAGTQLRLHVLGFTHLIGNIAGLLFGTGVSAHQID
jgi:hypothetical protein